jgi:hypothetical protein
LFYKALANSVALLVNPIEGTCTSKLWGNFSLKFFLDSHFRWCNIKALPGANRLIKHLKSNGVPMALASNSPRESIDAKISFHDGVDLFQKSQASCTFLSLFVIMKVWASFLIYILFPCRMERFFLCHNWGRRSSNRETFPWHVRCKKMFCLALIAEGYLFTIQVR